ncbi:NAD(P)/FAD-dependent oxidoreductase [Roseovarius sp. EL26]|uniref:FAD-dependent oxidoreductase n=1 Tax=Roseovarius sp. EL26 TaxID=2126672 RepID=UPI000EA226C4|nr:NAD(P)/FAD-dependent oxidoreductase [Roseovarius sp. EL26]
MPPKQIGIAGAGIGGLAAAAALSADGHQVTVFDQFTTPAPVGSGLVIQPVGQDVLDLIGAGDMARQMGQPIKRMLGHESTSNRAILDVTYDPKDSTGKYGLAMHRSALFHAVLEAAQHAGATLCPDHQVTGVTSADKRQLIFETGAKSPPFDLIVDATGAKSPLSPLKARALPYGAIWGTVDWPMELPVDTSLPLDLLSQRYHKASTMIGILPVGFLPNHQARKAALFWSLTQSDLEIWRSEPIEVWKTQATTLWPAMAPFLEGITDHTQMTTAFYSHGTLRTPAANGLVHIGDAAHRASPQLGQGANMALLDAWALSLSLKEVPDISDALRRYTRMRRRHLWLYQLMSAAFTPLYQSDSRWLPRLRDHILTPLSRIPPAPSVLSRLVCGDLIRPIR